MQKALDRLWTRSFGGGAGIALQARPHDVPSLLALFSYRVFYRVDLDEEDPILAGVTIQDHGSFYRLAGDVSAEESGTIYYEEACQVSKNPPDVVKAVQDVADRLAGREVVVLEALSRPTPPTHADLESEPSRSSDG